MSALAPLEDDRGPSSGAVEEWLSRQITKLSDRVPAARSVAQFAAAAPCKTFGSAYVGSNPTPATTYNASSSGMRPDHRRWLLGLRADPALRSCEFRRCRVWPGQSTAAGSRRNLRAWALLGAVEWWLSRSRAAAVTGEAGRWLLRWPAGSLGYAAGTWTPGGAGFSTAPLTAPGRLAQASVRPPPPPAAAAPRPVPGWHDARRRLPRGPSRRNRCRPRRLGPGKAPTPGS